MTPKKFWTKKAALAAVEDCQLSGWTCGIIGARAPFLVQAISSREDEAATGFSVKYDLCTDGKFHEYSRKAIATERAAEVRMAAATARVFAADKKHAAACADGLTYGDPVFDAAQAELDAAGAEWDAQRAAQWTEAEAREFGDYRSNEEMAAHYGKEGRA